MLGDSAQLELGLVSLLPTPSQEGNLAVQRAVLTSYSAGLSAPWSQQLLTSLVMSIYPCFSVEGQGGRSEPFQPQDTEILLSPSALPYEFKTYHLLQHPPSQIFRENCSGSP